MTSTWAETDQLPDFSKLALLSPHEIDNELRQVFEELTTRTLTLQKRFAVMAGRRIFMDWVAPLAHVAIYLDEALARIRHNVEESGYPRAEDVEDLITYATIHLTIRRLMDRQVL
jgi:hypothetical protein